VSASIALSPPAWYAALLLFFGAQRLLELVLSRRNQARLFAAGAVREAEPLFPLMVLTHLGLIAGSWLEVALLGRPFLGWISALALLVLALAQALRAWALFTLKRSWNVQIVVAPSQEVIDGGPYAYIRHPNYLAVILEIAALPLAHGAYLTAVAASALNAVVLTERIRREEEALFRLPAYRERMGHKPRLWPF
jgi:methyltransferase